MLLNNMIYNILKSAQYFFIIFVGSYSVAALSSNAPLKKELICWIMIYIMFSEIILLISSMSYHKAKKDTDGTLQIEIRDLKDIYRLQLNTPLEDLAKKKSIILLVDPKAKLSD